MPALEDGNYELIQRIKHKILESGKIPFRDFMQMALYTPNLGYYTSGREVWGKRGDYLTSPDIHHVFGKLICKQLFEMWQVLGEPQNFTIIEAGAGNAALSLEVIKSAKDLSSEFYKSINLIIIEINPFQKERVKAGTHPKDGWGASVNKISWYDSIAQIKDKITGCIISNELIDAFPVHVIVNENGTLKEVYVSIEDNSFIEVLDVPSNPAIEEYLKDISLAHGQRIEVNLEAVNYIKNAANILDKGFVITIDYGLPAKEFYETFRNGSLLCYYKHKINDNPYNRIGFQDMTSHVDFTNLAKYGKEAWLEITGFTTQIYFLMALGILDEFKTIEDLSIKDISQIEWNQKLKELIMPGGMGSEFKVLIQHKGIDKPKLKGFSYRDFKDEL
ncbi:MAG: SAM-dependent methyltransferase [Deltaproteobacteria bacterium]|nr:SAM-dependent methyltransferase [Deltaproteobacteria bacterium]